MGETRSTGSGAGFNGDDARPTKPNVGVYPTSSAPTTTNLSTIELNEGARPKGFVPYNPTKATRRRHDHILALFEEYRGDPAVGPRSVGYRLKERYVGEYTKKDFAVINNSVTRMVQAGTIPMSWVSDAAAVTYVAGGWQNPAEFLRDAADYYQRNLTAGQPVVVEVFNEARETASLIRQVCTARGVGSYSGGGTSGPNLAYWVACRAIIRAVDHGQSTLILGLGDFDVPGLKGVMRPHIENVAAFLYGTDPRNDSVLSHRNPGDTEGNRVRIHETDASVSFRHLGLTPEMALDLLGLAEQERDHDRITRYIDSGEDIFTRDTDLLDGVQKIELEAVDPVTLKTLVTDAIEDVLDLDELHRADAAERDEREDLETRLGDLADEIDEEGAGRD